MTPPWQTGQPALEEGSTGLERQELLDQHDPLLLLRVVVVDNHRVVVVVVDIASLSRDLWAEVVASPPEIISHHLHLGVAIILC